MCFVCCKDSFGMRRFLACLSQFRNQDCQIAFPTMPMFYFDIQIGSRSSSLDEQGEEHKDLEVARIRAGRAMCSLARDLLKTGLTPDLCIEVRDNSGTILCVELNYRILKVH